MKTAISKALFLFVTLAASGVADHAVAQSSYQHQDRRHPHSVREFGPVYGFGFGYGPSTAAESMYRGYADLVRAWGENNYHNSMAQVYWEQAREKGIANRTVAVEQFFALRKFNHEQRMAAIAKSRLSKQQLVSISKKAAPQRLGEEHWNLATDGLAWPAALQRREFAATRTRLDELFRFRRDSSNGLVGDELTEANQLASELIGELKSHISEVKPMDYIAAKRFLTSIAHEASFNPISGERLALK
jgi:hypothetical protein